MAITQIEKVSVADKVYESMLEMVADGTWSDGTKIPSENELSELFGVSRNTVRQVIQKMNALGILEAKQGRGTFVKKIDTSFYLNSLIPTVYLGVKSSESILEFEKSIQVESVKIAGKKATLEEIDGLAKYIELMKENISSDAFYDYDKEYHLYLSKITRNELFVKSMNIFKRMMRKNLVSVVNKYGRSQSIKAHEAIYQKLREGNVEEAARIMDEHLQLNIDRALSLEE